MKTRLLAAAAVALVPLAGFAGQEPPQADDDQSRRDPDRGPPPPVVGDQAVGLAPGDQCLVRRPQDVLPEAARARGGVGAGRRAGPAPGGMVRRRARAPRVRRAWLA